MPTLRADLIDAYLYRRVAREAAPKPAEPGPEAESADIELLQLRRRRDPLAGTWQPVMGHIEAGETAVDCLWREIAEETGLVRTDAIAAYALEQVHPFFLADSDEIVLSPRFAVEVAPSWEPSLNDEHDDRRWVPIAEADDRFLWPGQHAAIAELRSMLRTPARAEALRLS